MPAEKPKNSSKQQVASSKRKLKTFLLSTFYFLQRRLPKRRWLRRLIVALILAFLVLFGGAYGIAQWYIHSQEGKPLNLGVTFIPDYASYLGVNPQQTMSALINDLHVKNFRLVSYWNDIEPSPGKYNFSQLDWEFAQANAAHAKITLAIGLRQPRWPECHAPGWVDTKQPTNQWQPQLEQYMTKVIDRYKNNPALASYQLENEYFNKFGACNNFSRSRLVDEFNLTKSLDPTHPIILSRSNNYAGLPIGQPRPDVFGISVYRRVWSPWVGRYAEYPFPAWYYAFLAGAQQILTGKPSIIHELQAEPWPPDGKNIPEISLAEQNKTMSAKTLQANINFAKATGIKTIYLWGGEYWYYRMVKLHDPSLWHVAEQAFAQANGS